MIMGRPTNDWDFTTNATPEEILKVIPGGFTTISFWNSEFQAVIRRMKNHLKSQHIEPNRDTPIPVTR